MEQGTTLWIKKEELDEVTDDPGCMFLQDPLKFEEPSVNLKKDLEMETGVDTSEPDILQDSLKIEDPWIHIKQEPEIDIGVDSFVPNVVASTSYASNSTRFIQNSDESCHISCEETVKEDVVYSGLEIRSDESKHFAIIGEEEEEEGEEYSFIGSGLKCTLEENKLPNFYCSICLQSFTSKYLLIMHVFVHIDGVQPPIYVCKSCGEVFPSNLSMNKHLKMSEIDQSLSADIEKFDYSDGDKNAFVESTSENVIQQTEKQCSSKKICKASEASFHNIHNTNNMQQNAEKRNTYGNHEGLDGNINGNLKRYALIHSGIKPHKCDVCCKTFTQLSSLKTHGLIHSETKAHKCYVCGNSYTRLSDLKSHALIHTGTKPHQCNVCGTSFRRLSHLKSHALMHTGNSPHKCDICFKTFTQLQNLKRHALIHTGDRPHKCDICFKTFTHLSCLKRHALIHSETKSYKCDFCCKTFTQLHYLKRHALIHTG